MKYGLIGEHLGHSYSQQIHERIAPYEYELHPLAPRELEDFIRRADYCGINVTIPYKKAVIPFLDELSPEAEQIGSVNTIVRQKGRLHGYNTDYSGFVQMVKQAGMSFSHRKVLILGTGGTSAMAQVAAADMSAADIVVVSRSGSVNYKSVYEQSDADIIINTTPVGMFPNDAGRILELERFSKLSGVLDAVYNPLRTNLVCDAQKLGIRASGGLPMLVYQAVLASELFTGRKIDEALSARVVNEMYQQLQNIVLVGMPGSGKTTLGEILAARRGRSFIDIDECIVKETGSSIPTLFAKRGEEGFRALEHDCIAQAAKTTGAVIATGGGAVLDPENMRALKRNGRIYYLKCDIDDLSTEDRPLSSSKQALEALYHVRHPLYTKYSNVCIDRNSLVDPAAVIEEDFNETSGC